MYYNIVVQLKYLNRSKTSKMIERFMILCSTSIKLPFECLNFNLKVQEYSRYLFRAIITPLST